MGLFGTPEERAAKKAAKLKAKQAKKQAKLDAWMSSHGLSGLNKNNLKQVARIRDQLWGTSFFGTFANDEKDQLFNLLQAQQGIIEQNWLLIKQLDQLQDQNDKLIQLVQKLTDENNEKQSGNNIVSYVH